MPDYEGWTLDELVAEQHRLAEDKQAIIDQLRALIPYLDEAWREESARLATRANPALAQVIGGEGSDG